MGEGDDGAVPLGIFAHGIISGSVARMLDRVFLNWMNIEEQHTVGRLLSYADNNKAVEGLHAALVALEIDDDCTCSGSGCSKKDCERRRDANLVHLRVRLLDHKGGKALMRKSGCESAGAVVELTTLRDKLAKALQSEQATQQDRDLVRALISLLDQDEGWLEWRLRSAKFSWNIDDFEETYDVHYQLRHVSTCFGDSLQELWLDFRSVDRSCYFPAFDCPLLFLQLFSRLCTLTIQDHEEKPLLCDRVILQLADACRELEQLTILGTSHKISLPGLAEFYNNAPKFRRLELASLAGLKCMGGNPMTGGGGGNPMSTFLTLLKPSCAVDTLVVAPSQVILPTSLENIRLSNLRDLQLMGCCCDATDQHLMRFLQKHSRLERITLDRFYDITLVAFLAAVHACPDLQSLCVTNCHKILLPHEALQVCVTDHLPRLSELTLDMSKLMRSLFWLPRNFHYRVPDTPLVPIDLIGLSEWLRCSLVREGYYK